MFTLVTIINVPAVFRLSRSHRYDCLHTHGVFVFDRSSTVYGTYMAQYMVQHMVPYMVQYTCHSCPANVLMMFCETGRHLEIGYKVPS